MRVDLKARPHKVSTPLGELTALPTPRPPSWIWRAASERGREAKGKGGEGPLQLHIPGSFFYPSPPLDSSVDVFALRGENA